ncbi:hypothetical protein AVEN_184970-1 [Araneus ventricosus]|uniref:Uncharacterized protein n=1 Tax=Araneus ventricosus TaxID=182803 RepID=A0A4Y1ZNG8_ARAVE|nr:hypothetical protein AVEN_6946-1 [Araneus ventricosus]GBL57658.1 hypothetical protein AVEN_49678-1 [Araneus ventricosus]GBO08403.1 hypothetical protein AVEN_136682-1 [Araneus ventricosus]GBO08404.1 hypothetical protein AVEN_184970-1 [Araneus ventricosus]
MDLVILNRDQMTRRTPEQAPTLFKLPHHTSVSGMLLVIKVTNVLWCFVSPWAWLIFTPYAVIGTVPSAGFNDTDRLVCIGPTYAVDLHWNRVANLEPSDPEARTSPLDHSGYFQSA